jgi:hypothetical protein
MTQVSELERTERRELGSRQVTRYIQLLENTPSSVDAEAKVLPPDRDVRQVLKVGVGPVEDDRVARGRSARRCIPPAKRSKSEPFGFPPGRLRAEWNRDVGLGQRHCLRVCARRKRAYVSHEVKVGIFRVCCACAHTEKRDE